jgi:biotin operon repressor
MSQFSLKQRLDARASIQIVAASKSAFVYGISIICDCGGGVIDNWFWDKSLRRPPILTSLSILVRDARGGFGMRYERSLAVTKRLDDLLGLIRRSPCSARVLASKLDVSEQTVYRDVRFLKRQGHDIHSVKLADKWGYHLSAAGSKPSKPEGGRRR